jgi:hypothetical protein
MSSSHYIALGAGATVASAIFAWLVIQVANAELSSPTQIAFSAARADHPAVYANGCHLRLREVIQPACVYALREGKKTIVLFGDSHGAHWLPALERIAETHRWTLYSWTKSACPSFDVPTYLARLGRDYFECVQWRSEVVEKLRVLKPDLVVLANAFSYLRHTGKEQLGPDDWWRGMARMVGILDDAGIPVLVLGDTPWPGFDVPQCLSRAAWRSEVPADKACRFVADRSENIAEDVRSAEVVASFPRARFLATRELVCPTTPCSPIRDHTVMYHDHSHLSSTFSRALATPVDSYLKTNFPSLFRDD